MVILDKCWQYGNTPLGFVSILFIIFGIGVILGTLGMFDEFSIITVVWITAVSLGLIICGAIGVYRTRQKEYKVFLQDMTLEEFETEYEPINFEGLIIKARRKENSDERSN